MYSLSLHDALPILQNFSSNALGVTTGVTPTQYLQMIVAQNPALAADLGQGSPFVSVAPVLAPDVLARPVGLDRKSTRLNSSHRCISYAVFCLKTNRRSASTMPGYRVTTPTRRLGALSASHSSTFRRSS